MERNSKRGSAFLRLICIVVALAALIWASAHFIQEVTPMKVLPVVGIYIGYKLFSITLDIIKLFVKAAVVILIIYLLIF